VIQVLYVNPGARGGQNVLSVVALFAAQSGVPAGEREAGLPVIHGLPGRLPSNERKVRPIVVGVAAHAILARPAWSHPNRVHASTLRKTVSDFGVAIQAF